MSNEKWKINSLPPSELSSAFLLLLSLFCFSAKAQDTPADNWSQFRGNHSLTGVSQSDVPRTLKLRERLISRCFTLNHQDVDRAENRQNILLEELTKFPTSADNEYSIFLFRYHRGLHNSPVITVPSLPGRCELHRRRWLRDVITRSSNSFRVEA